MKNILRAITGAMGVGILVLGLGALASGQYGPNTNKQTGTTAQGTPTLTATLVDAEKKAQQKAATVSVTVTGIKLIDPGNEQARAGEGHLHYQVDDGPIIATPTAKLSFHGLTPGQHKILVVLAGNDHNPLGPQQTLTVAIP